ncbi:hypothetical protein WJX73_007919 [Symbiochloris irregularis]|uniref:BZIP domain-containing protein n=1 Tax=Symbiochloris irregularis TaxID=706552 RepID=A0AAW1PTI9_9CHLO
MTDFSVPSLRVDRPGDQLHYHDSRSHFSKSELLELEAWPGVREPSVREPAVHEHSGNHSSQGPSPSELRELMLETSRPRYLSPRTSGPDAPPLCHEMDANHHNLRRSQRQHSHTDSLEEAEEEVHEERRRPGRPVIYRGDPDASHLTDQQRRQIKRRIANRESARRMRDKKQESDESLQIEIKNLKARASALESELMDADHKNAALRHHLREVHGQLLLAETDKAHLRDENNSLKAMQVTLVQAATCTCNHQLVPASIHTASQIEVPSVSHQLLVQPWDAFPQLSTGLTYHKQEG